MANSQRRLKVYYPPPGTVRPESYSQLYKEGRHFWTVEVLDPWNSTVYKGAMITLSNESKVAKLNRKYPGSVENREKEYIASRIYIGFDPPKSDTSCNASVIQLPCLSTNRKDKEVGGRLRTVYFKCLAIEGDASALHTMHKDAKSNAPDLEETTLVSYLDLYIDAIFLVRDDMPLRAFAKFIGPQLDKVHVNCISRTLYLPRALMSEFDTENKGKDGFLHITYTGNEKGDDSEFIDVLPRTKSRAAARSDIIPDRIKRRKPFLEKLKPHDVDAWKVRERGPDHIPVWVEKDASSDIPDIDMKKYNVHRDMPLREFVDFIRLRIQHESPWKKSLFVYFKNTEPPIGTTLMSEVDEKNGTKTGLFASPTVERRERRLDPLKSTETVAIRPRS